MRNFLISLIKKMEHELKIDNKQVDILKQNCLALLSKDSIWIYTLMKSGTTYTLLFLSNYYNYLYGNKKAVDYDEMKNSFIHHSIDMEIGKNKLDQYFQSINKSSIIKPKIIHTHTFIESELWKKNISIYRNPMDFIISSYFYWYINRGIKVSHPRKKIDRFVGEFIKVYNNQLYLKDKFPNLVLMFCYEELIREPEKIFKDITLFLNLNLDKDALNFALINSSRKKIKEMEANRGEAIVKRDGKKFNGSFIRSGKIGEWKEYFTDKDLNYIEDKLKTQNISINNFIIE